MTVSGCWRAGAAAKGRAGGEKAGTARPRVRQCRRRRLPCIQVRQAGRPCPGLNARALGPLSAQPAGSSQPRPYVRSHAMGHLQHETCKASTDGCLRPVRRDAHDAAGDPKLCRGYRRRVWRSTRRMDVQALFTRSEPGGRIMHTRTHVPFNVYDFFSTSTPTCRTFTGPGSCHLVVEMPKPDEKARLPGFVGRQQNLCALTDLWGPTVNAVSRNHFLRDGT